ncbi:hypothetical protein EON82_11510 [bacterium]|nr:MAG: hypothetical protein EON82_11510 [bacterium]
MPFPLVGISFQVPATRLELLLPELSKVVGTSLGASAALKDERLVIAWHDRSSQELLKDIAEACAADWERDENGLRLVRSTATDRRLTQAALDLRVEAVRNDLAKRKPLPPFDPVDLRRRIDGWYRGERDDTELGNDAALNQSEARRALFDKGPGGRLTDRALRLLPPGRYANIVGQERRAFSTRPTGAQEELGPEFQALLTEFCREQDAMTSASKGVRRTRQWSGDPTTEQRSFKPTELVLEIEVTPYAGMRPFEIHTKVRKPGDSIFAATGVDVIGYDEAALPKVDDPTPYVAIEPPQRTKEERLARTRRPDLFDPMADRLLDLPRLASLRRRDLVARVDDMMGRLAPFLRLERNKKGLTVGKAFERLLGEGHALRDNGSTLLISPIDEPAHRRDDCNRNDLRDLFSVVERQGYVSIESSAAFAQRNGKAAFEGLGRWSVAAILPGSELAFGSLDPESLRLYGALSPAQRASALAGRPVPVVQLNPTARSQASRLVFGMKGRHDFGETEWTPQASDSAPSEFDRLPNGAYVTGSETSEPIVYTLHAFEGREYRTVSDAATLGTNIGMAEGQDRDIDPAETYKRLVAGNRRQVVLKIVLDGKRSETLRFKEDRFPRLSIPIGWNELPESFRKAIRSKADAQAKVTREFRSELKKGVAP